MKNDDTTTPSGPPSARATARAGQIIGERYRLEELLERGAMGSVWRAEQLSLRTPVAIKFLEPSLIGVPEMNERFMQEARSAAAVRSTHVIQIFDYGRDGNVPFIAMEFLEGEDLDARLSSRGTLTPSELNKIFSEVARGIAQAHAMGVVHRDLKPANIFIAREGEHEVTKVIDFGIAKVKADALKLTRIVGTQLGSLLGTPQYMSPEQVRGSRLVDHRTDLWALAIIACECLTGCYPFTGTTIGDLSVQICTEKPRAPSSLGPVPAGFDRWFFRGTARNVFKRFDSVEEMAAALDKILSGASEVTPAPARSTRRLGSLSTLAGQHISRWGEKLSGVGPRLSWVYAKRTGWVAPALLLFVCGVAFLWLPRQGASVEAGEGGPSRAIHAASPAPLPTGVQTTPIVAGAELGVPPAVGVASEDVIPLGAPVADAGPEPAAVVTAPRERKRATKPSSVDKKTPFGAMSVAMGQAGARIMRGDGTLKARVKAATPVETRARTSKPAPVAGALAGEKKMKSPKRSGKAR